MHVLRACVAKSAATSPGHSKLTNLPATPMHPWIGCNSCWMGLAWPWPRPPHTSSIISKTRNTRKLPLHDDSDYEGNGVTNKPLQPIRPVDSRPQEPATRALHRRQSMSPETRARGRARSRDHAPNMGVYRAGCTMPPRHMPECREDPTSACPTCDRLGWAIWVVGVCTQQQRCLHLGWNLGARVTS